MDERRPTDSSAQIAAPGDEVALYPGRLTPEYLQAVSFPPARLGKRGVDEGHVRVFFEWVESELVGLLTEKAALEHEVQRLRNQGLNQGPGDSQVQAMYILSRAQQTADKYVANAQEYSRDIAEDARRRREEIVSEAKMRASVILAEARATVGNASAASGTNGGGTTQADLLAAPVAADPMTSAQRQELQSELAHLRTSGNACRSNLRAHLESLTRSIDEWEHAEEPAASNARHGR